MSKEKIVFVYTFSKYMLCQQHWYYAFCNVDKTKPLPLILEEVVSSKGCKMRLFLQLRITDASMIPGAQLLLEHSLNIRDIFEGDGACGEMSFANLSIHNAINQI